MTRLALLALAVLLLVATAPERAEASSTSLVQARPGSRPLRKSTQRTNRSTKGAGDKHKEKLRADRGQVRPDRSPLKAKVATGDQVRSLRKAGKTSRLDISKLPLDEQIAVQIEELLRGPLRAGTTSLYVADAISGKPVFSVYPDDPLNPASNVKLIATATALDILGPDYRYTTRLLGHAPDETTGVLADPLYLLGSYDPTFGRTAVAELAQQLIDGGLTRLEGDIVVGDTPTRDGMYRSFVEFMIVAGAPGAPPTVTMDPPNPFVEVVVTATTSKKKRVRKGISVTHEYVDDALGHKRLRVTIGGQIGRDRQVHRDLWMKERAYFTAHTLRQALLDLGVEVTGDVRVAPLREYLDAALVGGYIPVPIAEQRSKRLAEIVQRVNKRSTNWLADRVVMTAAARRYGGKPAMDKAIDAMYAWLAKHVGLGREDVVIDSGSGLSYKTELSARQVVSVLRAGLGLEEATSARDAELQEAYRTSLSVGGVDGTLRRRFKHLDATVRGKTGTLSRVVSLAGMIEVGDKKLVFSLITNGHEPHWKGRVRDGHEKLVALLSDYLHKLQAIEDVPAATETLLAAPGESAPGEAATELVDELGISGDPDETDEESIPE